jgi:hypothetical protein
MRRTSLGLALALTVFGCGSAGTPSGSGSEGQPPGPGSGSGAAPGADAGASAGNVPDAGTGVHVKHVLDIRVAGDGDVRGDGIVCRRICQQQFDDGQTVHLVALAYAEFHFDGWQGDCSGTGACELTMSADRSVVATFTWSATIDVAFNGMGAGRLISSPPGIDCPGSCAMTVPIGTPVTLTAYPDAASTFLNWGGACSGGATCKLGAYSDQTLWANFAARTPPPVSSCADIAPPDTARMTQFVQSPWYGLSFECGGGTTDASATVALVVNGAHGDVVDFMSPDGTSLGSGSTSMGGFLLPQPIGFSAVSGRPYLGPTWAIQYGQLISDFDSGGKSTGSSHLANHSGQFNLPAAADPNGGVLFAGDLAMGPSDPAVHAAVMYGGGGTSASVRWGPYKLASAGTVFGVGVDLLGRSLVITDGTPRFGAGNISAQWFDKDGTIFSGEFVLLSGFSPGKSTWFETTALIGGGLLVRRMDGPSRAQALVVLASGSEKVNPAPGWMVSRRDVKLQIARGGKAYAALPLGQDGVLCTQRVEVLAPDGTSCGATDFPIAGGTCDTLELSLGADGTIIQRLPDAMEQRNNFVGGHTCTWRWWPAALR